MTETQVPLCMNCKHFGIAHPAVNLYNSDAATPEQKNNFVRSVILTHGMCTRTKRTNLVTGDTEYSLASVERDSGACNKIAFYFRPHSEPEPTESNS